MTLFMMLKVMIKNYSLGSFFDKELRELVSLVFVLFRLADEKSFFSTLWYLHVLRLRFSHLNKHKFRHGFLDTLNPLCNCSLEIEDNEHFFLRCLNFENARRSLFTDISSINSSFKNLPSHLKVHLLLYGDSKLSAIDNNLMLKASIKYIMTTNRFSVILFWLFSFFNFEYIYLLFPPGVHPLSTFLTVLFETAVRYVLVLHFLVSFLVIFLHNIFHLFFVLSNCDLLYCRKKKKKNDIIFIVKLSRPCTFLLFKLQLPWKCSIILYCKTLYFYFSWEPNIYTLYIY